MSAMPQQTTLSLADADFACRAGLLSVIIKQLKQIEWLKAQCETLSMMLHFRDHASADGIRGWRFQDGPIQCRPCDIPDLRAALEVAEARLQADERWTGNGERWTVPVTFQELRDEAANVLRAAEEELGTEHIYAHALDACGKYHGLYTLPNRSTRALWSPPQAQAVHMAAATHVLHHDPAETHDAAMGVVHMAAALIDSHGFSAAGVYLEAVAAAAAAGARDDWQAAAAAGARDAAMGVDVPEAGAPAEAGAIPEGIPEVLSDCSVDWGSDPPLSDLPDSDDSIGRP